MSGRTQKLNQYLDDVVLSGFEIKANANDATFTYPGKALKMDGDLQYKNGVAYTSVLTQFGTVIASVNTEYNRALTAEGVIATITSEFVFQAVTSTINVAASSQDQVFHMIM